MVGYGWYLLCQNLQIRFGNCDHKPQGKTEQEDNRHMTGIRHLRPDLLPHGRHGKLRPQREEHHARGQEYRSKQKKQQDTCRDRRDRETEQQYDPDNGTDCRQCLFQFICQSQIHVII